MEIKIINHSSGEVKSVESNSSLWNQHFSSHLISLSNRYSLFNNRQRISKTKTKGEVSGGGRKPWRQKGTGRARQGSIRSPQWKGGGVVFGPTGKQNYRIDLNKKVRKQALASLLCQKFLENTILFIDQIVFSQQKTKQALALLEKLKIEKMKTLVVLSSSEFNETTFVPFRNLPNVSVITSDHLNVPKIMSSRVILFTEKAIRELEERIS